MLMIHTADIHLGATPDRGESWGKCRKEELWENFEKLIETVVDKISKPSEGIQETDKADKTDDILKDMIKNERNVDFANKELAYIAKLREQE